MLPTPTATVAAWIAERNAEDMFLTAIIDILPSLKEGDSGY